MKLFVLFGVLATVAYVSGASAPQAVYDGPIYELRPVEEDNGGGQAVAEIETEDNSTGLPPIRERRVTCDVLSWQSQWLSINHSACAVRCLTQRRKGGRCQDGVCICRN
ncbi:PREDICTED: defensin-2-like [Habropoda laboriosa]|nr:PREDICTED: defensin-2-like [Habropoda laboriosa]